jgi:preprotein translocase subunit SecG
MTKLTSILAIGFMVNSIVLTTLKSREAKKSLFDSEAPVAQPLNSDVQDLNKKELETTSSKGEAPAQAEPATAPSSPSEETNTKK